MENKSPRAKTHDTLKKVLLNDRSLTSFCLNNLSVNEIRKIIKGFTAIKDKAEEQEQAQKKQELKRQAELERINMELKKAGLSVQDLVGAKISAPPMYEFTENGERKTWTGKGRMPKYLKEKINSGEPLDKFLIQST